MSADSKRTHFKFKLEKIVLKFLWCQKLHSKNSPTKWKIYCKWYSHF